MITEAAGSGLPFLENTGNFRSMRDYFSQEETYGVRLDPVPGKPFLMMVAYWQGSRAEDKKLSLWTETWPQPVKVLEEEIKKRFLPQYTPLVKSLDAIAKAAGWDDPQKIAEINFNQTDAFS